MGVVALTAGPWYFWNFLGIVKNTLFHGYTTGATGILFKRKTLITPDDSAFESAINTNILNLVSKYLKSAENFSLELKKDKKSVLINKAVFKFTKGYVGDFKHKDIGLLVNPDVINSGQLELLSLGSIEVISLEVSENDLRDLIKFYAPDFNDMNVSFENDKIKLTAAYKNIPIEIVFRLYNPFPGSIHSDVFFELKKVKVSFSPLPAALVNFMVKDYNPFLNQMNSPIRLKFNQVETLNSKLVIN